MVWSVTFGEAFEAEFVDLPEAVQDELVSLARLLATRGPHLGRPHVDTLNGSAFANMKELRFEAANGVWRVAFAFDPRRQAVVLVAGDKSGVSPLRFYRSLIARADMRYQAHLDRYAAKKKETS